MGNTLYMGKWLIFFAYISHYCIFMYFIKYTPQLIIINDNPKIYNFDYYKFLYMIYIKFYILAERIYLFWL